MICSQHIAIVGGSGSGKTWLAENLCAELGTQAAHLSLDDFYRDLSHLEQATRDNVNFDDPAAIDWASVRAVADTLAQGEMAQVPIYDFTTHTRRPETRAFAPRELVVWDGLWLLHENAIRGRFVWSVFVDCPEAERLSRRMARDVLERGRTEESVRLQCLNQVQPMHDRFVEPQRDFADQILAALVTAAQVIRLKQELVERIQRQEAPHTRGHDRAPARGPNAAGRGTPQFSCEAATPRLELPRWLCAFHPSPDTGLRTAL